MISRRDILEWRRSRAPWKFDAHFGKPLRKQNRGSVKLIYRYESEMVPTTPMKIKIEINTREHFSVFGYQTYPLSMTSTMTI